MRSPRGPARTTTTASWGVETGPPVNRRAAETRNNGSSHSSCRCRRQRAASPSIRRNIVTRAPAATTTRRTRASVRVQRIELERLAKTGRSRRGAVKPAPRHRGQSLRAALGDSGSDTTRQGAAQAQGHYSSRVGAVRFDILLMPRIVAVVQRRECAGGHIWSPCSCNSGCCHTGVAGVMSHPSLTLIVHPEGLLCAFVAVVGDH